MQETTEQSSSSTSLLRRLRADLRLVQRLDSDTSGPRGGLAPWQKRKLDRHIDEHLHAGINNADLADLVGLSPFHFCRAFRGSFGESPHAYLMRRRIAKSQSMMMRTELSLAQIAGSCGLADQAHLNKLFRRFVGESPGAWRRSHADAGDSMDARTSALLTCFDEVAMP